MANSIDLGKITASVAVGTVTTGDAGSSASITNSGTTQDAIFNFTIPRGNVGPQGPQGVQGPQGPMGPSGYSGAAEDLEVVQVTGNSQTAVMSQKAVTDEVDEVSQDISDVEWLTNEKILWATSTVNPLRNGSIGNAGNAYCVATTNLIDVSGATKVKLITNRPNSSNCTYRWTYITFSVNTGLSTQTSNRMRVFEHYTDNDYPTVLELQSGEIGLAIAITEYNTSTNSISALRVNQFSNYYIGCYLKTGVCDIDDISNAIYLSEVTQTITMEQGGMESDGTKSPSISNTRCRTVDFIRVNGNFKTSITNDYAYNIFFYTQKDASTFQRSLGVWETGDYNGTYHGYIRVGVKKTNGGSFLPSSFSFQYKSTVSELAFSTGEKLRGTGIDTIIMNGSGNLITSGSVYNSLYAGSQTLTETIVLEQGSMTSEGKKPNPDTNHNIRLRSADFFRVYGNFTITIPNGYYINAFFYSSANSSSYVRQIGSWTDGSYSDNYDGYIMVTVKNSNGTTITPDDVTITITYSTSAGLATRVSALESALIDSGSYVYGADMIKRCVQSEFVGTLKYLQSFCIYDGKYYSTDGNNICEQDSSFNVLRDVVLPVGHGNSFQLVSGGKAWISGWNDNMMYKVDLSTLTIESTLSLPFNGTCYTTAVIDENNSIAYIFHRVSYPSTEDTYNFITWNYANNQIINTKVIQSFAAMQSADTFEGKILMLYGLGTAVAPSGMRIYNTSGDVLATFDLEVFRSTEPEGIIFERDTHQIYVSDVNKKLYKIKA